MKYSQQNMTNRELFKQNLESKKYDSEDAFEQDALEGWKNSGSKLSLLKPLDKRFTKNNSIIWIGASSVLLIGIIIFFLLPTSEQTKNPNPKIASTKSITIEKSDVLIPEKIDELIPVERKKSVQIKTLKANFVAKKNEATKVEENLKLTENTSLEPKKINEIPSNENVKLKRNSTKAFEIYIHDLLTVDYRKYRSKPVIKTESVIITGTSANKETENSSEVESTEWKQIDIPYFEYITKTMSIFSKGNYKKALTRFEEILKSYPDDLNANFYGALCYYNLGENQKAFELFSVCELHKFNNFEEDAKWYCAKSLVSLGKTEQAEIILKEIIESNGFYAKDARKMLTSRFSGK